MFEQRFREFPAKQHGKGLAGACDNCQQESKEQVDAIARRGEAELKYMKQSLLKPVAKSHQSKDGNRLVLFHQLLRLEIFLPVLLLDCCGEGGFIVDGFRLLNLMNLPAPSHGSHNDCISSVLLGWYLK